MFPAVEVSQPSEVKEAIDAHGVAIWRGMVRPDVVAPLHATASRLADKMRPNGVVHFPSADVAELAVTPEMDAVFARRFGTFKLLANKWESCFLFAGHKLKPTVWHQECETVDEDALVVWVALDDCGKDKPGLSVVAKALKGPDEVLMPDDAALLQQKQTILDRLKWPVITPEFKAGDAVFLTPLTVHKTHLTPEMTGRRLAYKITAVPK